MNIPEKCDFTKDFQDRFLLTQLKKKQKTKNSKFDPEVTDLQNTSRYHGAVNVNSNYRKRIKLDLKKS